MRAPHQVAGSTLEGSAHRRAGSASARCNLTMQWLILTQAPSHGCPQPAGRGHQGGSCKPTACRMGAHPQLDRAMVF